MKIPHSPQLNNLAVKLGSPLYIVGGYVRNFLIDGSLSFDVDLCSPCSTDEFCGVLKQQGFFIDGVYPRTGTVTFRIDGQKYEFTRFREDDYLQGGAHLPQSVRFTSDLTKDALRRDFRCNAVYYDVQNQEIVDPLGGVNDVKNRVLDTVKEPKSVFCHDGLRLMRLARFIGELNFTPTEQVLLGAKEYSQNVKDVSTERIWVELNKILNSDQQYSFSSKTGHYDGLRVLFGSGVLDYILPELTVGKGMEQRKDYHDYDVLEHSLRAVLYADKSVRLYALLHDLGKPVAMKKNGNFYAHEKYGKTVVKEVLHRFKADNKTIEKAVRLTGLHMADMNGETGKNKVVKIMVENADILGELLLLKQADFSACKDDLSVCPTVSRWQKIYQEIKVAGVPFSIKELKISANDLMEMGYKGKRIGEQLNLLFWLCVYQPELNDEQKLLKIALNNSKKLS